MNDIFTLYVECLGIGQLVNIKLSYRLPLAYIVCETFRQHIQNRDRVTSDFENEKLTFYGVMTPESGFLDLSTILTKEFCLKTSKIVIQFEGRLRSLPNYILFHISSFVGNDALTFSTLQRINKHFNRMFKTDEVWSQVKLNERMCRGRGFIGTEDDEWIAYQGKLNKQNT